MSEATSEATLDARWVRALAGADFRRADALRDERDGKAGPAFERHLRDLRGWLPPPRESHRAIARLDDAVRHHAELLCDADDATVAARFHDALAAVRDCAQPDARDPRLAQALACVGLAARRRLGLWPHPVQFAGTRVLLSGRLAELQTGEGKSLVAAMAATVMAASGAAVHVITTNDYLAQRDCEELGPLFAFFGLRCAWVGGAMPPEQRRPAYQAPVCYVSGKELVFDYLRDRLAGHGTEPARVARLHELLGDAAARGPEPLVPALHFAIVDEADSVLIDEARTPMILSREAPGVYEPELVHWAVAAARAMVEGQHFRVERGVRTVELLPAALANTPAMPESVAPVWRSRVWRAMVLRQALTALHLFTLDQHYIVVEGKVKIVDEPTGRVMPDRSWEQGLHQLIEAKEGVPLTPGRETLSRMTFQRFFRRYYLLAGLTGTAAEAARELWTVYRLRVCRLPPNRPNRRRRLADRCLPDEASKWTAVADEACAAAARGQPVLVGTRSVAASEAVSAEFARRSVEHVVLSARQDADEARVVARAGLSGRITVATNMAGRGTDIKLDPQALAAGGLHVILTEHHESPRVDRQLFGRSGRQGDPGTARAIVALSDGLFREHAILRLLTARAHALALRWMVRQAQSRAERQAYRVRAHTLKQDQELGRTIGFAGRVR